MGSLSTDYGTFVIIMARTRLRRCNYGADVAVGTRSAFESIAAVTSPFYGIARFHTINLAEGLIITVFVEPKGTATDAPQGYTDTAPQFVVSRASGHECSS